MGLRREIGTMSKDDPAKSNSLLADELEPLDEDFPVIEDPPPEPSLC
jgi:hypothetical protein